MNIDFFCFLEFCEWFVCSFLALLILFKLINFLTSKTLNLKKSLFFVILTISISLGTYNGWRCQNPSDDYYIALLEQNTSVSFSISGSVVKKETIAGFNDAIEMAVVKMNDSAEFVDFKKEVFSKDFLVRVKKKKRVGYFYKNLSFPLSDIDTIIISSKDSFTMVIDENSRQVFFQQRW